MWPLALPTAAVAGLVALAPVDATPDWLYRLAIAVTGEPLAPSHAIVLSTALLITARGLMLRRRAAWYGALTVVTLGLLAALSGADPHWRVLLLAMVAAGLWSYRDAVLVRPHPARVRLAVRTFAAIVIVSALACLAVGHDSARSVGHNVINGLGNSGGLDLGGPAWLPSALGMLGAVGFLLIVQILQAPAPPPPPGDEFERCRVSALVAHPGSDTLAPFALRHDKSYAFSPDQRAAIGYRVLFGVAAAGGDPVGDPDSYQAAINEFLALCLRMGWRPAVLGANAAQLALWPGLRSIGFGDEVIVRPAEFGLLGRAMRNVRQAVRRTHNSGVRTEIMWESDLQPGLRAGLVGLAAQSLKGSAERGFSMNLDALLDGTHPGCLIAIAYDRNGEPTGFQRYLAAGRSKLSLDAMRRLPTAPNGLNERLITDVIEYAREHGHDEVSLNFAAFRELLDSDSRGALEQVGYRVMHLLDPWIAVESLYLFDKKFHPDYKPRSVVFRSWTDIGWVAAALLRLEFGSHTTATEPATERVAEPYPEHS
jgi:lysyl-tRNA synthetase class 2